MSLLTNLNGKLPFEVSITGRKRNMLFRTFDSLFSTTTHDDVIATAAGPIRIDGRQAPERWLSYAFFNILKHYKRSDLGRYIALRAGSGKAFVDIGANLGLYSFIARLYGYGAYLVEPEPMHAAFLARNSATFGKVISVALSDRAGEMPLYYEERNSGATSLMPAEGYTRGSGVVPVRTFSSLICDGTIPNPDEISLIKVDVEGAEAQAIAGMRDFLDCGYRPAIWCEVRGDLSGRAPGSYREVVGTLEAYGYSATEYIDDRRRVLYAPALGNRTVFDLLFEAGSS